MYGWSCGALALLPWLFGGMVRCPQLCIGVFSSVRLVTIIRRKQPAVCRGCYRVHTHADPLFPVTSKAFFRLYYTIPSKNSNFEVLVSVYIIPYPPQKKNSILTTDSNNPKPPVLHLKSAVAGQLPATNMVSLLPVDIRGKRL